MIPFYSVFCQKIELKQNGKDTFFVFDRLYGKWLANKLDSLEFYKDKYKLSFEIINEQQVLIEDYKDFIFIKDDVIRNYKAEVLNLNSQIESYKTVEFIHLQNKKKLSRETRMKKFWKFLAITGLSTSVVTTFILLY
jgi:hypothetical protein